MEIVTRAGWDARPPRSRFLIPVPTPKLYLHHTASPTGGPARVRAIQDFHMDIRGWSDIAYSFLVSAAGIVYEGRGAGVAGGHTAGQNTISHAICAMGNYDTTIPSQVMLDSIRELLAYGHGKGWWPATFTGGHRDAPLAATSCPGSKLYALIPTLNIPPPIVEVDMYAPVKEGDRGVAVEAWQRVLQRISGFAPKEWGVFGADTTVELQRLTGPGNNIGPSEGAVLLDLLGASDSGGLTEAQVKAIVNSAVVHVD